MGITSHTYLSHIHNVIQCNTATVKVHFTNCNVQLHPLHKQRPIHNFSNYCNVDDDIKNSLLPFYITNH